ncbi:carboxylesterase/lipase family protein [Lentzea sp. NPDC059081]|uniref:carboxylesterase/lipase family protein n=1 Tax=Lentzea sp. NPDC059081 TaxID=3346719 RepID=UPI003692508E
MAALVISGGSVASAADDVVVRTDSGVVRGEVSGGTRVFEGIPYAAPPERWRDPRPPARWDGVRDATKPGPVCAQLPGEVPDGSTAEDCLYLNVTAPKSGGRKPVVVWVHGGGYFMGAGANYDARRFAERGDVVVVTVNYRLGIFGFFGMPGLAGSGTFGLRDQQAALRWVRANAGAFGGDPRNVTLAGQSAGAMSVCAQLTSPAAAGLFDRAVLQSGSCETGWLDNFEYRGEQAATIFQPLSAVAAHGADVARELGCADIACLRGKPVEELMPQHLAFIQPAYGTQVLPSYPGDAVRAGRFHRVPVLSGTTRDEATPWVAAYDNGAPMSEATYETVLAETFGDRAAEVRAEYPRERYGSAALTWAAIVTDRMWACTQYETSRGLAARTDVHQYEFADPSPPALSPVPPAMPLGAQHASDLWDFFDLGGTTPKFSPAQQRLSDRMIASWSAFARGGDPGWPRFTAERPHVRSLAPDAIGPVDLAVEHHCGFWAQDRRSWTTIEAASNRTSPASAGL